MFRKTLFAAVLIGVVSALAFAPPADSATTDTLTVTASIANVCIFDTTTGTIAFGVYDPIVANATIPINQSYTAQYTCTAGDATYTFAFASANVNGGLCRMTNGSAFLQYTISDGTYTTYCTGTARAATSELTATGTIQSYTGFTFSLLAGQTTATLGSYTDTNTLTIAP